jgi:hypothetical protein
MMLTMMITIIIIITIQKFLKVSNITNKENYEIKKKPEKFKEITQKPTGLSKSKLIMQRSS